MITVVNMASTRVHIRVLNERISILDCKKEGIEYIAKELQEVYDLQVITLFIGGVVFAYLYGLINLPKVLSLDKREKKD